MRRRISSSPSPGDGALDDDLDVGGRVGSEIALVVHVLGDIRLGQDDDRRRAALPCEHQLALEPADVEPATRERLHDEDDVDVGDQDLLDGALGRVLAGERRGAREDRLDDGEVVAARMREGDPVADDRAAAHTARLDQVDGGLGPHRPRLGGDERELAIDPGHAAGEEAVLGERPEQDLLALGPAEVGECGDVAVGFVRHVHRIARARGGVVLWTPPSGCGSPARG